MWFTFKMFEFSTSTNDRTTTARLEIFWIQICLTIFTVYLQQSCFLHIFVSTTCIIYSKCVSLFSSRDRLMTHLKEHRLFLKTFGKLFFINIEICSICEFWCFDFCKLFIRKWLMNLCRISAWMHCLLFYFCDLLCLKQVFLKIVQYPRENTCLGVGSLFLIKFRLSGCS